MPDGPKQHPFQFRLVHLFYLVTTVGVGLCVFLVARTVLPIPTAMLIAAMLFMCLWPGVGEFQRTGKPAWGIIVAMVIQAMGATAIAICRFNIFAPSAWDIDFFGAVMIITFYFLAVLGVLRACVVDRRWNVFLCQLGVLAASIVGVAVAWRLK